MFIEEQSTWWCMCQLCMDMVLTENMHNLFFEFRVFTDLSKTGKEKNQLFSLLMFTESIFIYCDLIKSQCLWLVFPMHQAVALFQSTTVFFFFQVGTLIFFLSPCADC